jgi:hypothetical protein
MPDDSEVVAPEQYNGACTPLQSQAPNNQRDQTDVLSSCVQDLGQFHIKMGPRRRQLSTAFNKGYCRMPSSQGSALDNLNGDIFY